MSLLSKAFDGAMGGISDGIRGVGDALGDVVDGAIDIVQQGAEGVGDLAGDIFTPVGEAAYAVVNPIFGKTGIGGFTTEAMLRNKKTLNALTYAGLMYGIGAMFSYGMAAGSASSAGGGAAAGSGSGAAAGTAASSGSQGAMLAAQTAEFGAEGAALTEAALGTAGSGGAAAASTSSVMADYGAASGGSATQGSMLAEQTAEFGQEGYDLTYESAEYAGTDAGASASTTNVMADYEATAAAMGYPVNEPWYKSDTAKKTATQLAKRFLQGQGGAGMAGGAGFGSGTSGFGDLSNAAIKSVSGKGGRFGVSEYTEEAAPELVAGGRKQEERYQSLLGRRG